MNSKILASVLCCLVLLSAGVLVQGQELLAPSRGIDDEFLNIAKQVPGFGGMFLEEKPELTITYIYLTDPSKAEAKEFIDRFTISKVKDVVVLKGQYDWVQLYEWRYNRRLEDALSIPGIVSTDIDESRNRIVVGVEDEKVAPLVEKKVKELNIPLEAVIIEKAEPIRQAPLGGKETEPIRQPILTEPSIYIYYVGGIGIILILFSFYYLLKKRGKKY